ncbi:hypothetical protein [Sphingomonas sp.]|uniref:hypothetical protein n=1 Tax=Sphingomonas sp. TaxID=28214 RepID=UPI003B3B10F2
MTAEDQNLPEGTDTIIEGASGSATGDSGGPDIRAGSGPEIRAEPGAGVRDQLFDRYQSLRGDAGDRARDWAQAGKDRATDALDDVVRMIEDAADEVDAKIGSQYGDYARRAAQGIGDFSDAFKNKDVDALFADARAVIQKSPGAALGVAAALGFVVARLVRSGFPEAPANDAPAA